VAWFEVYNSQLQLVKSYILGAGVPDNRDTAVAYPANLSTTLAVGASSDFDYRSFYSQYGATLTFVAPSGGGYGKVNTTDRTGNAGYAVGDNTVESGTSLASPAAAGAAALVLSRDGNLSRSAASDKLVQNCAKIGPVTYSGSPSRNDYYGYGRLDAYASVTATTADTTAPTFNTATVINYRAIDAEFSEPMGDTAMTPANYSLTAGGGTLSASPSKIIRIRPTTYRLVWTSGDMAVSGTVTVQASSSIKDVAGNALTTTSRSSSGTKRIIAVNCGNNNDGTAYANYYVPPFKSDNGFEGNEAAVYLGSDTSSTSTIATIDTSGPGSAAAPAGVYQTIRKSWSSSSTISYSLSTPTAGTYTVRLHFCEIYYSNVGDAVFDIFVNGSLASDNFDILSRTGGIKNKAYTLDITGVAGPTISVQFVPQLGYGGIYNASISGLEILKP
jgi:hypothetical protein